MESAPLLSNISIESELEKQYFNKKGRQSHLVDVTDGQRAELPLVYHWHICHAAERLAVVVRTPA